MKVAYVMTNFNNSEFTVKAAESIFAQGNGEQVLVVVDNNSDLEYVKILQDIDDQYDNLITILNKDNVGYFPGLNKGIEYVLNNHPDYRYLVVGNNDLIFDKEFSAQLNAKNELFEQYPVVSPDIVTLDGFHQNPHVVSGISKFREFIYDLYYSNYYLAGFIRKIAALTQSFTDRKDEEQYEIPQEIYQGYGACYILGPLFFENWNALWTPSFMMYEEFFLSRQLESGGYKIYYEPTISIKHHWHASMNKLPGKKRWEMAKASHKEYRKHVKVWPNSSKKVLRDSV